MSHIPGRTEKDCLNCGTIVQGRYCQHCGQENVVPKETFWHMVTHFFYDITHFDSSFFHTVHHLVFRPGFLSKEYMLGRRARYLHPIRMYVFSSALFFLLFFGVFKPKGNILETDINKPVTTEQRARFIKRTTAALQKDSTDSFLKDGLAKALDTAHVLTRRDILTAESNIEFFSFSERNYRSRKEYDSLQALLPKSERDGWFDRRMVYATINLNEKYRQDPDGTTSKLGNIVLHRLPYMLFVSLPLFALILRLVYIRRRQFYFADHGVFTIHLYIFSFLVLILVFLLEKLSGLKGFGFADSIIPFVFLGLAVYLFAAMRRFYEQGWWKTFVKFILVSVFSLLMMFILFLLFIFFSAATY